MLPLRGERVVLRGLEEADLPILRSWLQPGHEWQNWDGPYYPKMTSEQADAWVEDLRESLSLSAESGEPRRRLAVADAQSDKFMGLISWYFESVETNWRRIGITLYDPASWSGGFGTEAVRLWTNYLFDSTDIVRLDFATWSGNLGMCRIGEKLSWTLEGRFRNARVVNGQLYDSLVYGVLREEWEALRG